MRIAELKGLYKNETAWIVGLGPSIKNMMENCFGDGPIIALNQSIITVQDLLLSNPLYSMQKDDDPPAYVIPERRIPLILHEPESLKTFPEYEPLYVFNNTHDFGLEWNTISIVSAVEIARMMGCNRLKFVCCDAHAKGIYGTYIPLKNGEGYLDNTLLRNAFLSGQRLSLSWWMGQHPLDYSFIIPSEDEIYPSKMMEATVPRVFFMNNNILQELR